MHTGSVCLKLFFTNRVLDQKSLTFTRIEGQTLKKLILKCILSTIKKKIISILLNLNEMKFGKYSNEKMEINYSFNINYFIE